MQGFLTTFIDNLLKELPPPGLIKKKEKKKNPISIRF